MKTIAFAALLPIALSAVPRVSAAQDTLVVQYATKLLCGGSNRRGVAPGRYFTAVNVHNPYRDSVLFRYKFALTRPNAVPGPITPWTGATLNSDQALEIECTDSLIRIGGGFAKGFVVVETQRELDVVAVYTATAATRIQTMAIDRVPPRRTVLLP